jgi:ATP sulfurylase
MTTIGIVPLSGKPFHIGHHGLINIASNENDWVHVYVSTSDRDNVSGKAMLKIWKDQIEPILPKNVAVTYGGSPVGNAYKDFGDADQLGSQDTFVLYSDPNDAATNFPDTSLQKYAPKMFVDGRLKKRPVKRTSIVNISGTKMREFLASGNKRSFLKYMPKEIDGNVVWNTLVAASPIKETSSKTETLIKQLVRESLKARHDV